MAQDIPGVAVRAFESQQLALDAVRALSDGGFSTEQISIVVPNPADPEQIPSEEEMEVGRMGSLEVVTDENVPFGEGISVGSTGILVPNLGAVVGGPLAVAYAHQPDAAIDELLEDLGATDEEIDEVEGAIAQGLTVVVVAAGSSRDEAQGILNKVGA
ncbi:hypothetical protein Tter_2410 [Thermobaculum terrenum ATCC BAA-798]|uniref:Uncharacterized protein n=1 Tax=Thermobaculum terrenum (strain ATCC BAA-798 / CCMEE 7001 / YNP1) TaxID=525904 RepID=D1CHT4_THET1|nr:hypothetical protein [Thermobaculum terrenum]ACZ43305.1 hypothetical protein Tter_2410 [Thermobaculum terrenum ATCC BAA-798]